jgi:hypothetical protein
MKTQTIDRGAILHFAGRHELSPALRGGAPVLSAEKEEGLQRCGWTAFFDALDRAGPALLIDDDEPGACRPAPSPDPHGAGLGGAIGEARRFLAALRPPAKPS